MTPLIMEKSSPETTNTSSNKSNKENHYSNIGSTLESSGNGENERCLPPTLPTSGYLNSNAELSIGSDRILSGTGLVTRT